MPINEGTMNERALNSLIGLAMQRLAPPGYKIAPERNRQGRQTRTTPDLVVRMPYGLRTIIETEYGAPAITDAKARLGYKFTDSDIDMKSVIALGIPEELGELELEDIDAALMSDAYQFQMQVVTGKCPDDPNITFAPDRDKPVPVSLQDIVQYAWLAAIPEAYAKEVMDEVIARMTAAKQALTDKLNACGTDAQARLTNNYGNHDSANKMESVAGNIVGTLFSMTQLHANLKQSGGGVAAGVLAIAAPDLWQRIEPYDGMPDKIAREWRKIEAIDYMPLSTIAVGMLEDSDISSHIGETLRAVADTVAQYIKSGVSATTNVAAEIWQSLIPDRDERAAYYTKPATAELLANITTRRLQSPRHAKYNEICAGTGTLARATEENILFRHYAQSQDKTIIHAERMENCIQLTDINPQSISVATANMVSLRPETTFKASAMFAITVNGGSLNFLTRRGVANLDERLVGYDGEQQAMLTIIPRAFDICNNNDPYFRPRGGASNPITTKEMQRYKRGADGLIKGVANGQAGLATFMHVIEHTLLGYESPHGKVLPLTAAHAQTYAGFRKNIENEYRDVIAICTAAGAGDSMSDDTIIQEMLLIGTKHTPSPTPLDQNGDRAVTCVNLTRPFETKLDAKMFADAISREVALGKKHGEIAVGAAAATYYRMEGLGDGNPWSALGSSGDYTILAEHVKEGVAWDPRTGSVAPLALPMATLSDESGVGPTHHLLGHVQASHDPRGAFVMRQADDTSNRMNPSMWHLDADTQLSITCEPTHYGERRDDPDEAARMLQTAGHFHISRNLSVASQKIAMCYTEEKCMGGRSWTTIYAPENVCQSIALFLNSTYGMLIRTCYGYVGGQLGRFNMQVRAIPGHPIPDFAADTHAAQQARAIAAANFDHLRTLTLKRISLSAIDTNRAEIDRVVTEMLGLPLTADTDAMLSEWRRLMCLQPTVNGNNKSVLNELSRAGITTP